MRKATVQWIAILCAALFAGPLAGLLSSMVRAPDGGADATALVSANPGLSIATTLGALGIAAIMGLAAGRAGGAGLGLTCAGIVLVWGAVRASRLEGIVRRTQDDSALVPLAIEGALVCALTGLACLAIERFSRHAGPAVKLRNDDWPRIGGGALACAGVSSLLAWFMAQTGLAGQTIGAAAVGALGGTVLGRYIAPRAPLWAFLAAHAAPALLGPLLARALAGGEFVNRVYSGAEVPLARIMPLDWASGVMIGIPIGASWAMSMTDHVPGTASGDGKPKVEGLLSPMKPR